MKDIIVLATLIVAFATLLTVHVAIAARLILKTRPRWRGVAALVVPPIAPVLAFREKWRRSAVAWVGAVLVYVVARIVATR